MPRAKGFSDTHQTDTVQNNCVRIDEAIAYLKSKKLRITKKAIAEESGINYSTIKKKIYTQYLDKNYPDLFISIPHNNEDDIDSLRIKNEKLSKQLESAKHENINLRDKYQRLREDYTLLKTKYEKLLGSYITNVGNKITQL